MNKEHKVSNRKAREHRQRKAMTTSHILIAVVALIECLILVAFTTYSWIESSSSLVIMNGPQTTVSSNIVNLDIADNLNYLVRLDTNEDLANLNKFFRSVKYYEFSKCTSPDGKVFFFPRRNNTYTSSAEFRKGDTTDFNTSYFYYDFVIENNTNSGKYFYFDENNVFTVNGNKTVFDVTGGDTALAAEYASGKTYKDALRNAMRMSVTTQVGSGASATTIYSVNGTSGYYTLDPQSPLAGRTTPSDSDISYSVSTKNITDYVYAEDNDQIVTADNLFNAARKQKTKVSIRIWFDIMDPEFQTAFGFSTTTHSFESAVFPHIPSADICIKFALKCTDNDYQPVYFDDYTFSNLAAAQHLTDEQSGYRMWFYAYQPSTATPPRTAGNKWLPMTKTDESNSVRNRWYTGQASQSMMATETTGYGTGNNLPGGMSSTKLSVAKFVYAPPSAGNADIPDTSVSGAYTWTLPNAPTNEYYFNAYSYTSWRTTDDDSSFTGYGAGVWGEGDGLQDTGDNAMVLLSFDDRATAVTDASFNAPSANRSNFKFMNAKAESVINNGNASGNILYANNSNSSTMGDNYNADAAKTTAAMYYDAEEHIFKSYVPKKWLSGSGAGVYFSYCPNGHFSISDNAIRWSAAGPSDALTGSYVYSALGYSNPLNNLGWFSDYGANNATYPTTYFTGVGTWGDYEEISISTELIDTTNLASYRYYIGFENASSAWTYHALIPNYDHSAFSAYVPIGTGVSSAKIEFIRYSDYKDGSSHSGALNARWFASARQTLTERDNFSVYYPVKIDSSPTADYTRGFWNLSVLVDGTYENLIYDTLTDNSFGTLAYSYDYDPTADPEDPGYTAPTWTVIANDSSNSFTQKLDRYRFYAAAEPISNPSDPVTNVDTHRIVYWKWTPYDAGSTTYTVGGNSVTVSFEKTEFIYEHDTYTGIFKLITEAENRVSDAVDAQTGVYENGAIPNGYSGEWPTEALTTPEPVEGS